MKKKLLIRAGIGFAFGAAVGTIIAVLSTAASENGVRLYSEVLFARTGSAAASLLLQILFSGLYGAVCMGGTVVYEIEEWPLVRASLTHYGMCMLLYLPISLLLGWNNGLSELLIVIGIMTAVYFIIWLVMFLRYRAEVRELNDINRRRNAQTDDKAHPKTIQNATETE